MYKIGTKVPFSGKIIRIENVLTKDPKYIVKDEHGVETELSEKDLRKLMED